MTPQPGTAGTDDDPLDSIETKELVVNGQTIDTLVGLAFDTANATDGVLRFDGTGSTNGITDGSAKVLVNGTVHDVAGGEWVDFSGASHTLDSWEKVVNSQFDTTITGVSPDPVAPGNTLDVTASVTNNGTDSDTQAVTLDIDNGVGQVDSASVTLSGGGSTTQTLSWAVPSGQTGQDYTATVSSADDSASQTVTVSSPSVPSSAIHRWKLDDVGTGTATDSIGSADGTVSGVSNVSGTYQGGSAGDGDGSNDYIDTTALGSFGSNMGGDWAVAFTIETTDTSSAVLGSENSANNEEILICAIGGLFTSKTGAIEMVVRDANAQTLEVQTGGTYNDGSKYRFVWNVPNGAHNPNDYEAWINNSQDTTTVNVNDGITNSFQNFQQNMGLFARNKSGSFADHHDGVVDDVIFYDSALSSSEIADDYNIQPWS